jgi:hypothetical protein
MLMFTWQCHYQNQDFRPIIGQNQHFPGHHLATHFFQGFGCSWYIYIFKATSAPPRAGTTGIPNIWKNKNVPNHQPDNYYHP